MAQGILAEDLALEELDRGSIQTSIQNDAVTDHFSLSTKLTHSCDNASE